MLSANAACYRCWRPPKQKAYLSSSMNFLPVFSWQYMTYTLILIQFCLKPRAAANGSRWSPMDWGDSSLALSEKPGFQTPPGRCECCYIRKTFSPVFLRISLAASIFQIDAEEIADTLSSTNPTSSHLHGLFRWLAAPFFYSYVILRHLAMHSDHLGKEDHTAAHTQPPFTEHIERIGGLLWNVPGSRGFYPCCSPLSCSWNCFPPTP